MVSKYMYNIKTSRQKSFPITLDVKGKLSTGPVKIFVRQLKIPVFW